MRIKVHSAAYDVQLTDGGVWERVRVLDVHYNDDGTVNESLTVIETLDGSRVRNELVKRLVYNRLNGGCDE